MTKSSKSPKLTSYRVIAGTIAIGSLSSICTYRDLDQAELHASQLRADGWDSYVDTIRLAV